MFELYFFIFLKNCDCIINLKAPKYYVLNLMSFFKKNLCVPHNTLPILPPPPPPLPFSLPKESNQNAQLVSKNRNNCLSDEEELSFIFEKLTFFKDLPCKIFHLHYVNLKPQLQVGPMCGLVALSIASTITQNPVNVNDIFNTALSLSYTKQGEIFNVKFLADLAEKCCGFKARIINGDLKSHVQCIIYNLLRKNLILVPYDADHNFSPCCKKGNKAHWAVISGFAIFSASFDNNATGDDKGSSNNVVKLNSNFGFLCNCEQNETSYYDYPVKLINNERKILITKKSVVNEVIFKDAKESKIYLIGRQGKSKHIGVWLFDEMAESNNNLMFFSKNRKIENYVLPIGGLPEGLKSKVIILQTNSISPKKF